MAPKTLIEFCRALPRATEDMKWGNDLVFSIGGKMFAIFDLSRGERLAFKASPGAFAVLSLKRGIEPAPYLARHHWISIVDPEALPQAALRELLRESYELVFQRLPAKVRTELVSPR